MRSRSIVGLTTAALVVAGGVAAAQEFEGHDADQTTTATTVEDAGTVETLDPEPETATADRGASAFAEWVRSTDLMGCQRGQTVATLAQQGPTEFEAGQEVEPVPSEDLPGNCAHDGAEETAGERTTDAPTTDAAATEDLDEGADGDEGSEVSDAETGGDEAEGRKDRGAPQERGRERASENGKAHRDGR